MSGSRALHLKSALRRRFGAVRALALRARQLFPLTPLGTAVLGGAAAAYFGFGVPRVDYVIQLVSLLAGALVLAAVVLVVPGAWILRRALSRAVPVNSAPVTEARRGLLTMLRLPRVGSFPLLDVSWRWDAPSPVRVQTVREGSEIVEHATPLQRAQLPGVRRTFTVEDAFGLARLTLTRTQEQAVQVLPFAGRLEPTVVLHALSQGEDLPHPSGAPRGDRVDMRRYVAGDPIRLVLWKVYARTGQLVVRTPEHALSPTLRVAAFLVTHPGDEPAAAMARSCVQSDVLGTHWMLSTDGGGSAARTSDEALGAICRSRHVGPEEAQGAGIGRFVDEAQRAGQRQLIIFAPAVEGAWIDPVVRAIRRWSGTALVVVVAERLRRATEEAALPRMLRFPERPSVDHAAEVEQAELERVCVALSGAGATVVAVERETGRMVWNRFPTVRRAA